MVDDASIVPATWEVVLCMNPQELKFWVWVGKPRGGLRKGLF